MTVREYLARLQTLDIRLSVNGDRLHCSAPVGALTPDLRAELERMKPEVLAFLRSSETAAAGGSTAVPMRATGTKPPLFVVPGHNGDVFCYLPMLRHLAPEQPVFALEPPGLDQGQKPITTIPQLATHFVEVILATRSEGPFLIAGYCMGGVTAFEIASQLRARGHEVPACALFATVCPTFFQLRHVPLTLCQLGVTAIRRRVAGRSARDVALKLIEKLTSARAKVVASPMDAATERSLHLQQVTDAAVRRYRPAPFDGRLTLYLPNSSAESFLGRKRDWTGFASRGAEIVTGPADCKGDTMLQEPCIAYLGPLFQQRLDAATSTPWS